MAGIKGKGGQPGRSGRKSRAEELGLQALLDKCWTPEDREACLRRLAAKANEGEMEAVKLLFSYAFGKPKEHVENKLDGRLEIVYVNDWRG